MSVVNLNFAKYHLFWSNWSQGLFIVFLSEMSNLYRLHNRTDLVQSPMINEQCNFIWMSSLIHSSVQTVHQPTCSFLCFWCDTWFCQLFAAQYSLWIGKYCETVSMFQIIALQHRPPSTSHITLPLKSEFTFCVITEQSISGVLSPTNLSFVFLAIQISFSCQPNKAPKASIMKFTILTFFTSIFALGYKFPKGGCRD